MRATASGGISMRLRAALAFSGDGSGGVLSTMCLIADLGRLVEPWVARGEFSGIDITVQRKAGSPSRDPIRVNTCVPRDSSGSRIVTGASNRYLKPCRTKSLFDLRLTRTEIGAVFRAEPGTWAVTCCGCESVADVDSESHLCDLDHRVVRNDSCGLRRGVRPLAGGEDWRSRPVGHRWAR